MDSEHRQRIQKKDLIGENLEAEDLPLEHTQRKDNKNVTIIKQTPCAYVHDLKEEVISYIEDLSKYKVIYYFKNYQLGFPVG